MQLPITIGTLLFGLGIHVAKICVTILRRMNSVTSNAGFWLKKSYGCEGNMLHISGPFSPCDNTLVSIEQTRVGPDCIYPVKNIKINFHETCTQYGLLALQNALHHVSW